MLLEALDSKVKLLQQICTKTLQTLEETTCTKVTGFRPASFLKKDIQTQVLLVKFDKFFRTTTS